MFSQIERSRGTGPRATGTEGVLLAMRRSESGDPELRSLGHAGARGGQAPALRTHRANLVNPANPAPLLLIVIIVEILLKNQQCIRNRAALLLG